MGSKRTCIVALLSVCLAFTAAAAPPQSGSPPGQAAGGTPEEPPDPRKEAARLHYQQGAEFFQQDQLELALLEFTTAYKILPLPEFLYNMARCELKMYRDTDALRHLRQYLDLNPEDPEAETIRKEIAELEERLGKKQRLQEEAVKPPAEPEPPPAPLEVPPRFRPYTIATGVATGAFLVIGVGALGGAGVRFSELEKACAPLCSQGEAAEVRRIEATGYTFLGLMGAALTTTVVLVVLDRVSRRSQTAQLGSRSLKGAPLRLSLIPALGR